jgi:hypothetical protein
VAVARVVVMSILMTVVLNPLVIDNTLKILLLLSPFLFL